MKKMCVLTLTILIMAVFAGCSMKAFDADEDTVYVQKKGTVIGAIVEKFEKDYYDAEELEEMINSEVAEYNGTTERKSLEVASFEVASKMVKLFINYETAEDYAAFNKTDFFTGTVDEAVTAGYEFDGKFTDAKDKDASVNAKKDILKQAEYNVVILEEQINVQIDGEILYVSENTELLAKNLAKVAEGSEGLAYIVYEK